MAGLGHSKIPWSAIVVGRWNSAILSPIGLARRLLSVPEGTEFFIGISLDGLAPTKIGYGGLFANVQQDKLVIEAEKNEYPELSRAIAIGKLALDDLPLTPVLAAGFNVYLSADPDFKPFVDLFNNDWNKKIDSAGYPIIGRGAARTVEWNGGHINFSISQKEKEDFEILVNFHKQSANAPDLRKWLSVTTADIREQTEKILSTIAE